jgi:hypothetical protein
MGAKVIQINDGGTYRNLPGGTGNLNRDGAQIRDTIYGQAYESMFPGIKTWSLGAQALYKGVPGYAARLLKKGSTTAFTNEACSLVSGKTYRINDATKSAWDRSVALTIKDGAATVSGANIASVNYLFGEVTFASGYTVTGAVTVTGSFLPLTDLCKFNTMTLTMNAAARDETDNCGAQGNGGYRVYTPGLRSVKIDTGGFFDPTSNWDQVIGNGVEYILEVNADGLANGSRARGFFNLMTDNQSGDVGATEAQTLSWAHQVPLNVDTVFDWRHGVGSLMPLAVQRALSDFLTQSLTGVRYLPDGAAGWGGQGVLTDVSMSTGLEQLVQFAFALTGSGAITVYP